MSDSNREGFKKVLSASMGEQDSAKLELLTDFDIDVCDRYAKYCLSLVEDEPVEACYKSFIGYVELMYPASGGSWENVVRAIVGAMMGVQDGNREQCVDGPAGAEADPEPAGSGAAGSKPSLISVLNALRAARDAERARNAKSPAGRGKKASGTSGGKPVPGGNDPARSGPPVGRPEGGPPSGTYAGAPGGQTVRRIPIGRPPGK